MQQTQIDYQASSVSQSSFKAQVATVSVQSPSCVPGPCPPSDQEDRRSSESYRPFPFGTDERVRQLLQEQPIGGDARFGCYLIADSSPYSDIARSVECRVFEEFFGNDPSIMIESYGPYERYSKFLLMIDRERQQPAGVIRIIEHSVAGLKTFVDIEGAPLWISTEEATEMHEIDLAKTWDIGSLAVLKEYRGGSTKHFVCTLLYGQLYLEVCKAGIEHLTAILDEHAFRQLIDKYGVPFVPIAGSGPFSYLGSERNYAAYARVSWIGPGVEACMKNKAELRARRMSSPDLEIAIYGKGLATPVEVG